MLAARPRKFPALRLCEVGFYACQIGAWPKRSRLWTVQHRRSPIRPIDGSSDNAHQLLEIVSARPRTLANRLVNCLRRSCQVEGVSRQHAFDRIWTVPGAFDKPAFSCAEYVLAFQICAPPPGVVFRGCSEGARTIVQQFVFGWTRVHAAPESPRGSTGGVCHSRAERGLH
jgi:hypothetical protein